ncbi:hypothetical protein P6166_09535 [Stenotrophomonas sp. HITSZ_GD]|uniref:hypothetical protein n=1 Tax=Stenotrophomonas sp. HITSZ_GD TaxID=3037248 RepID=UPI00240E7F08|nr:hypothetical protein [Stenotrophomonas sp. HITSZ_GD]MDG2525595.1 hypothetical protein [Stenotrophomonas sp. HITSZ_GD]
MNSRNARFLLAVAMAAGFGGLALASGGAHAGPRARSVAHTGINHPPAANRAGGMNRGAQPAHVNRGGAPNVNRGGNVNRNANIDRNVNRNVNRDIDVHRDIDVDVDNHWHDGWYDHPVATAAAVTATTMVTAAVVGSIVNSVPPSCVTTVVNGIAYQQCGSTWYQPQYAGTTVQYVVVNPPG